MSTGNRTRTSGILLHPTSLPSLYGIGDLGKAAYDFIDFLEKAGQHLWQILPLTPTGYGNSPYSSFSAFAGQPLLISPEHLAKLGLLKEWELDTAPDNNEDLVEYEKVTKWKNQIFKLAFSRFQVQEDTELKEEYDLFVKENAYWLDDYAIYMACRDMQEQREWFQWDDKYRKSTQKVKTELKKLLKDEIQYHCFVQFLFLVFKYSH